jgi:hypothetical protein
MIAPVIAIVVLIVVAAWLEAIVNSQTISEITRERDAIGRGL